MTTLEQLARECAVRCLAQSNLAKYESTILAALKSVAEQKDAEAAALREALIARVPHTCKMEPQKYCDACTVLATDAGTALLRELEELKRKLAALPGDWLTDSSLETWFPITAEELKSLRERVKKAEWQPIATAPKDGTRILLWCQFGIESGYWESKTVWVKRGGAWINFENRSDTIELDATHWQPLPQPPTALEGQ